jgi:purine-binding chemotaxis protein CheW
VVRIGKEFFGIALDVIREFANLRNVTPIPCCPPHVLGQMNLRGELITIADIRNALGLDGIQNIEDRKVVVMNDSKLAAGVVVDELLGVIYPTDNDLSLTSQTAGPLEHVHRYGYVADGPRTLSLIDFPSFLRRGSLIVNEKPS